MPLDEYRRKRGEQFLKDIRTRVDVADKQFKLDKTAGSLTQKGRVFMLLGAVSVVRARDRWIDRRCERCGYLIAGISSEQCPECGVRRSTSALAIVGRSLIG